MYQASIQCWAIISTPAQRHLNGVSLAGRWWPINSVFYILYSSTKKKNVIEFGPPLTKKSGNAYEHNIVRSKTLEGMFSDGLYYHKESHIFLVNWDEKKECVLVLCGLFLYTAVLQSFVSKRHSTKWEWLIRPRQFIPHPQKNTSNQNQPDWKLIYLRWIRITFSFEIIYWVEIGFRLKTEEMITLIQTSNNRERLSMSW